MIATLLKLYTAGMAGQVHSPVPHLFGPPGSGKSSVVQEAGRLLGVKVHIINVSRLSPLELEGVQLPEEGKLRLLLASMWNRLQPGDIILWDEFLACSFPEVFNGLLDIITSREVGGHQLPPVFMIAASNTTSTYASALEDRLLHLPVPDPRNDGKVLDAMVERFIQRSFMLPGDARVQAEVRSLLQLYSVPAYDVLDQLQGSGTVLGQQRPNTISPRKLEGLLKLRYMAKTPELNTVIRINNRQCQVNLDENWKYMTVTSSESSMRDDVQEDYLGHAIKGLDSLSPEMQAHHLVNIQMMKLRTMSLKEGS